MDFPKSQGDGIDTIPLTVDSSCSISTTTNTFTPASQPSIIINRNDNNKVITAVPNGVCNVLTSTCTTQPNTGFTSVVQGNNGSIILISHPINTTASAPVSIALQNGHTQVSNVQFNKEGLSNDLKGSVDISSEPTFKVPATPPLQNIQQTQFSVPPQENNGAENVQQTFLIENCQSQSPFKKPQSEQQFIASPLSSPLFNNICVSPQGSQVSFGVESNLVVDHSSPIVNSSEQSFIPILQMPSPTKSVFATSSSDPDFQELNVLINGNAPLNSTNNDSLIGANTSAIERRCSDTSDDHLSVSTRPHLILSPDLSSFSAFSAPQSKNSDVPSASTEKASMLHTLLTSSDIKLDRQITRVSSPTSVCSPQSPEINTDSQSEISSPIVGQLFDSNTQSTLISKSEHLHLDSESNADFGDFNWDISSDDERKKAFKSQVKSDAPSSILEPENEERLFEAGSAVSTSEFRFRKFGADVHVPGVFTFGSEKHNQTATCTSTSTLMTVTSSQMDISTKEVNQEVDEILSIQTAQPNHVTRARTQKQRVQEPALNQRFPMKMGGYELRIVEQPEEQHRARYLTEGSRGAVKNRSGDGHITLKLVGKPESAVLQVFVGTDSGCIKPHGFYQACKVCGKNSTPCRERDIDGTIVIEMDMESGADMTTIVDNVGILKLRNADVEQRIGLAKAKRKSTKARLIFRAIIQKPDGNLLTLQIASDSILCTQPVGQPEICKISLHEAPVSGGGELFIIGKNFMKGTKVLFQQPGINEGETIWEDIAEIDKDYFQPTHLICTIPKFRDSLIMEAVKVQIVVNSAGKLSDPQQFTYTPDHKRNHG